MRPKYQKQIGTFNQAGTRQSPENNADQTRPGIMPAVPVDSRAAAQSNIRTVAKWAVRGGAAGLESRPAPRITNRGTGKVTMC